MLAENVTARIKLANLAIKAEIADFVEDTDFGNKLKNVNKKVTSNKTKHVLVESELNEPSEKVDLMSTKGLTKDLIDS